MKWGATNKRHACICRTIVESGPTQRGYTLIELLAVMFVVFFIASVHVTFRAKFGPGAAFMASVLAVLASSGMVILFYKWMWSRDKRQLRQLREKYRNIYRVKELPTEIKSVIKPADAEIQIGDFGWEAIPSRRDGLIHLQGLTLRWQVVWHAGFLPNQIEQVAIKPASQYDYWIPYWSKCPAPSPCPYPVRERNTSTMGLPYHSGRYFENNPSQNYRMSGGAAKEVS